MREADSAAERPTEHRDSRTAVRDSAEGFALGAACAIFDVAGRVLLVRHAYPPFNWELPGGGSEPGEPPDETAVRELAEETGLRAEVGALTGVYFEPGHDRGPMLHFVFRCTVVDAVPRVVRRGERHRLLADRRTSSSDVGLHAATDRRCRVAPTRYRPSCRRPQIARAHDELTGRRWMVGRTDGPELVDVARSIYCWAVRSHVVK